MREIKFRAWHKINKKMIQVRDMVCFEDGKVNVYVDGKKDIANVANTRFSHELELLQFTGLKDKNEPSKEVYECDIIDQYGKVTGNTFEMDKRETDLVIEGFGTKTWCATYKEAVARGCTDAE